MQGLLMSVYLMDIAIAILLVVSITALVWLIRKK